MTTLRSRVELPIMFSVATQVIYWKQRYSFCGFSSASGHHVLQSSLRKIPCSARSRAGVSWAPLTAPVYSNMVTVKSVCRLLCRNIQTPSLFLIRSTFVSPRLLSAKLKAESSLIDLVGCFSHFHCGCFFISKTDQRTSPEIPFDSRTVFFFFSFPWRTVSIFSHSPVPRRDVPLLKFSVCFSESFGPRQVHLFQVLILIQLRAFGCMSCWMSGLSLHLSWKPGFLPCNLCTGSSLPAVNSTHGFFFS